MQEQPSDDGAVLSCTREGESSASHELYHAHRNLAGARRAEVAEEVSKQGAFIVHQDMVRDTPADQLLDGNITEAPPRHVTRQAAYERRKSERYSSHWSEDLLCRMEDSAAADTASSILPGDIHLIGMSPLTVHLYREHFLRKYSGSKTVLHIDATGAVTKQIGAKRPFLYALVAEGEPGETSYPLAHLLAESHSVPTLSHFLTQLARDFKIVTKTNFTPPRVVMDYSWALIHAVVESLSKKDLCTYLEDCWAAAMGGEAPPTLVSLCGAHISHQFSRALAEHGVRKASRPGYMWLFARLQSAQCLSEMDTIFVQMCTLALSKEEPTLQLGEMTTSEDKPTDEDDVESLQETGQTYRTKTSFGRHFDDLAASVKADVTAEDQAVSSPFYAPAMVEYMLQKLMSLAPLWSQVLSGSVASNAAVEAYMGVVKGKLLRGRRRLHTCEFVRILMNDTSARVKADMIPKRPVPRGKKRRRPPTHPAKPAMDRGRKPRTRGKTDLQSPSKNPEHQEEMWAKRDPVRPTGRRGMRGLAHPAAYECRDQRGPGPSPR